MKKRNLLKTCLVIFCIFISISFFGQNHSSIWVKSSKATIKSSNEKIKTFIPNKGKYFQLNMAILKTKLRMVNAINQKQNTVVEFPNIKGEIESFTVTEASVFHEKLQQQYPEIRSYIGQGKNSSIRFSVSPQKGLSLTYTSGDNLGFIERKKGDIYIVYKRSIENGRSGKFECTTEDFQKIIAVDKTKNKDANDSILRTYLLALSVTAEYTEYHFGSAVGVGQEAAAKTSALAAINASITRVNGIFERDFAVQLQLIANVDDIIFTNPATDPYSDASSLNNWNTELQNELTTNIGEANYDIGHLFGATGGGGNAGCIACVCVDNLKGSGYTSPADGIPEGDFFDIDYVSHELGHQFGATHTWTTSDSGPSNEGTGTNLEPGSGSTIMGYAGITPSNVQAQGDDYFHFKSIEQVTTYIKTTVCATEMALVQNSPTANAGSDYIIPISTAFILQGEGTSEGITTFCWEQNDIGGNGGVETSNPNPTNLTGPMFRSIQPTTSAKRYMPKFSSVLSGSLVTKWESVSSVGRDLKFKMTVRDNIAGGGQNAIDNMKVTVDASAGPFTLTSQNTEGIIWKRGSSETITWDVSNTNLAPINTSKVNILLSIDGGETFSILVANTPNDGTQNITVPFTTAPFCRIMIQPVNNIYYAVNSHSFSIDYEIVTTCTTYSDSPNMTITDDWGGFDETTITIPGNFDLSDINITVDVSHTYLGDLLISLLSPDGTEINLIERACSDFVNLNVVFDDSGSVLECNSPVSGTFKPSEPLVDLINESGNGVWTLRINDNGFEDTGTLNSWSIEICSKEVTELPLEYFFNVYPNPSNGAITISLNSESQEDINLSLIDMAGRLVTYEKYQLTSTFFKTEFNYGVVAQGIYILKIVQGDKIISKKIIVN